MQTPPTSSLGPDSHLRYDGAADVQYFLDHIAKVFFFILQEFMNNQQNIPLCRNIPNFPEAFHQSLFDLQVLTSIFMENSTDAHYVLGARIMTLMATASTDDDNKVLQFALQELHNISYRQRDLPAQFSSSGYGANIMILCRDKLLNSVRCELSLTLTFLSTMIPVRKAKTFAPKSVKTNKDRLQR